MNLRLLSPDDPNRYLNPGMLGNETPLSNKKMVVIKKRRKSTAS
tara:strand:+ start:228 stop:359 length:132 start_codon:yes stop_codon:yes gene_type:complete